MMNNVSFDHYKNTTYNQPPSQKGWISKIKDFITPYYMFKEKVMSQLSTLESQKENQTYFTRLWEEVKSCYLSHEGGWEGWKAREEKYRTQHSWLEGLNEQLNHRSRKVIGALWDQIVVHSVSSDQEVERLTVQVKNVKNRVKKIKTELKALKKFSKEDESVKELLKERNIKEKVDDCFKVCKKSLKIEADVYAYFLDRLQCHPHV